ncbi:hypothetical protein NGM37_12090, partial [Streptomyces sp. TRM76130]|nr:hypothetical protein [Streptomyces sp. TRM76130]
RYEDEDDDLAGTTDRGAALAAGLTAELAREGTATAGPHPTDPSVAPRGPALWDDRPLPLLPLRPPRTGREILTD